ncbi:MAG: AAA family ATPase [Bacteroidota bacterium]
MYLKNISIRNFRGIQNCTFFFKKGLNVIIGENGSGKSTLIDALRICFSQGNYKKDIFISLDDFCLYAIPIGSPIEFDLLFELDKPEDAAIFYEILVQNGKNQNLELHFRYYLETKMTKQYVRSKVWGGDNEGQQVPYELYDLLNFVYLDALRDAGAKMRPGRGNLLGTMFDNLTTDGTQKINKDYKKALSDSVSKGLKIREWDILLKYGESTINEHLKGGAITGKESQITLDFIPQEFRQLVDLLQIKVPFQGSFLKLYQNGLGDNNLIYAATVLGDLLNQKNGLADEAYFSLMIEEPEAHLHPQKQNTFFTYLNNLKDCNIQLFFTSHSPTITAKIDVDSLIVLQKQKNNIYALPLSKTPLQKKNKEFLTKFLDVTKSQLFFANGVLFVEGISEALLMPIFALKLGAQYDLEKNGIEIVNLNGVAFEHFALLYNNEDPLLRLPANAAIITDGDEQGNLELSGRAKNALSYKGGSLIVKIAKETFENELFIAGNSILMIDIYNSLKPRVSPLDKTISSIEFVKKVKVEKSDFAYNLLQKLNIGLEAKSKLIELSDKEAPEETRIKLQAAADIFDSFLVPKYIEDAIKWVIQVKSDV